MNYFLFYPTQYFSGQQYFSSVLPDIRDIYSKSGAVLRIEANFVAFVEKNIVASVETLNHAVQLGIWRDPLAFQQLELVMTPILVSQPAIFMLQLAFEGDRVSVTSGGVIFRRIGPKSHVLMQSDLYPSCISIGIFGCSRNLTFSSQTWYSTLKAVDMAQFLVQTQLDPLLDPTEIPDQIPMGDPCNRLSGIHCDILDIYTAIRSRY